MYLALPRNKGALLNGVPVDIDFNHPRTYESEDTTTFEMYLSFEVPSPYDKRYKVLIAVINCPNNISF